MLSIRHLSPPDLDIKFFYPDLFFQPFLLPGSAAFPELSGALSSQIHSYRLDNNWVLSYHEGFFHIPALLHNQYPKYAISLFPAEIFSNGFWLLFLLPCIRPVPGTTLPTVVSVLHLPVLPAARHIYLPAFIFTSCFPKTVLLRKVWNIGGKIPDLLFSACRLKHSDIVWLYRDACVPVPG